MWTCPQANSVTFHSGVIKRTLLKIQQAQEMNGVMEYSQSPLGFKLACKIQRIFGTDSAEEKSQELVCYLYHDVPSRDSMPPTLLIASTCMEPGGKKKKWRPYRRSVLHLRWKIDLSFSIC